MLNLVLILLITIFLYIFCIVFLLIFFSPFHPLIIVCLRILFLYFLGLSLLRSLRFFDSGNRYERLARVDFYLSLKHLFLNIFFLQYCFCFLMYRIISISCPISCVWFVDMVGYRVSSKHFLLFIFFLWEVLKVWIFKLAYNKFLDRTQI